jgi:hypothetical protein
MTSIRLSSGCAASAYPRCFKGVKKSLESRKDLAQRREVTKVAKQTNGLLAAGLCALASLREAVRFLINIFVARGWIAPLRAAEASLRSAEGCPNP